MIPPDIELEKILSQRLYQLYHETRNTEYRNMALRLDRNIELEKSIAGLRERIADLEVIVQILLKKLEEIVQILSKQTGSQT